MSESLVAIQPAVQQFLDRQHGLWIEGRQAASDSEKRLNVYNPATGEVIASTADASVDDVDRAVMSGWRACATSWRLARPTTCWKSAPAGGRWRNTRPVIMAVG